MKIRELVIPEAEACVLDCKSVFKYNFVAADAVCFRSLYQDTRCSILCVPFTCLLLRNVEEGQVQLTFSLIVLLAIKQCRTFRKDMYRLLTVQSESSRTLKSLLALLFTITKQLLKHSFPRKMSCLPLREQQKAKENRFVKMSNRSKICLKLGQNKKANDEQNTQRICSTTVKEYQSLCFKLLFSQTYRTIYDNEINLVRNDCLHWNFSTSFGQKLCTRRKQSFIILAVFHFTTLPRYSIQRKPE